jgi:SAM-dependent MidA family methyltransferase
MPRTPLEELIRGIIATEGPMPIDRFFSLVLGHPEHGYYMVQQPFGLKGDFVTSPEVSQIFGELIGIWFAAVYQSMGSPVEIRLIETGPGQGLLMADLLRAARVVHGFREAIRVHFVETSERLRAVQREAIMHAGATAFWHSHLDDVPRGPFLLIGNEFFDALPIKQYQRRLGRWHERFVGVDSDQRLCFRLGPVAVPDQLLPAWARAAPEASVIEVSAVRENLAESIGQRLRDAPGAALFIDYGHLISGPGETLQAMRAHRYVSIFDDLGLADLTSHVDFGALGRAMTAGGAKVLPALSQRVFLTAMGIEARMERLLQRATANEREALEFGSKRLVAEDQMGTLFKVLAAVSPGMPAPYPFGEV